MKTAVFNVRMDIRALATIHKHYTQKGTHFSTVSTMVRQVVEATSQLIVSQLSAQPFLDTTSAVEYLEGHNLMKPLRSRGASSLIKQMQKESLDMEGIDPSYIERKGVSTIDSDQYSAAKRALGELLDREESGPILGLNPGDAKEGEK